MKFNNVGSQYLTPTATSMTVSHLVDSENGESNDSGNEDEEYQLEHYDPILREIEKGDATGEEIEQGMGLDEQVSWGVHYPRTEKSKRTRESIMIPRAAFRLAAGPRSIPTNTITPADYLDLFLDEEILATFVESTNRYMKAKGSNASTIAKELTVNELRRWIAVTLYMMVVFLPDTEMYWEDGIYGQKLVKKLINFDRYQAISANLHYIYSSEVSSGERGSMDEEDCYWSVTPFVDELNERFKKYCVLDHYICIDEETIICKGRHPYRCYIPTSPSKCGWHLKAFSLKDAMTGYLWHSFLSRGKEEKRPEGMSAVAYPVWVLTNFSDIHNNAHILGLCDRYGRIEVTNLLADRGIDYIIKVRTKQKGLPSDCIFTNKGASKTLEDSIAVRESIGHSHAMYFTAYKDKYPLHLLSSIPPSISAYKRKVYDKDKGYQVEENVRLPSVVHAYGKAVGNVRERANVTFLDDDCVSMKWQIKIIRSMLRHCVHNASVLYNYRKEKDQNISISQFAKEVILNWTGVREETYEDENEKALEKRMEVRPLKTNHKNEWIKRVRKRTTGYHSPLILSESSSNPLRGKCKVCHVSSRMKCQECGIFLCVKLKKDRGDITCWDKFHTQDTF